MGSTTHIVDGEGGVQNTYAYDAWGNVTEQTENVPNRFKFNGQQLDPISQQYYLRARFYNPVIARFTQEDTYRGDGLNLYAYCGNNPVVYEDSTGNMSSCQKDAYTRNREEGMTAAEAYQAATGNIGVSPQAMTDIQMQMAIDSIYQAGNREAYNARSVQALTITPDGRVVLSANSQVPQSGSIAEAQRLFGSYLLGSDIVRGNSGSNYMGLNYTDSITGRTILNGSHAEARAVAHLLGDLATTPVPRGVLTGTRQATSAYSCNACATMQNILGITNVTGTQAGVGNGRIQRMYY